jgi:hypothetical protein
VADAVRVEAHMDENEELPWCGVHVEMGASFSRGRGGEVEAHSDENEELPWCGVHVEKGASFTRGRGD